MVESDSTHPQHRLTVAHLIKKIFLVSDNDAYNYLFDFWEEITSMISCGKKVESNSNSPQISMGSRQ